MFLWNVNDFNFQVFVTEFDTNLCSNDPKSIPDSFHLEISIDLEEFSNPKTETRS